MTPTQQQFEVLRGTAAQASIQGLPDGSQLIIVPAYELPDGWSKPSVDVKFIAPVGYPLARPDCFWTDADLRLKTGGVPMNTGATPLPFSPGTHLWFSWHVAAWNPNNDSLLTYLYVIKRRLHDPR
jgi:hypothetical protein